MRHVRIAAYPLMPQNAKQIALQARESGVYGIEVDNDITGRYETLLDPREKLKAIRNMASAAHANHNKAFVYIAGLECISKDAAGEQTLAKRHPAWLQRKITGEPALFDSKAAFWIQKNEEDAWISPYATDWRKLYMKRVRQIAATGIDGIYVDIPYWMTHFKGWEDSWASFDQATVDAFRVSTGLDARRDIKLGDYNDPGFRKWIDFRIRTITNFVAEIRLNAVAVRPSIAVIPEIFPGIEEEAPRVGADVYQLYAQSDAIAHEYEYGDSEDHTAASRTPFDWFMYQIGMRSFRAFAQNKPTWMLNYSWDGAQHITPRQAILTLAMSELMAGANVWDARGHVMSGSNDMPTRSELFHWIGKHDNIFGSPREPLGDTGVYFSDSTRNIYPREFVASYQGTLLLLLQSHVQFQIVTPRTLARFHGKVLVLPDVRVVSDKEAKEMRLYRAGGGRLIATGIPHSRLAGITDHALLFPEKPDAEYLQRAQREFSTAEPENESKFLQAIATSTEIGILAPKNVVAYVAKSGSRTCIFFANFDGLKGGENETPTPQHDIRVTAPVRMGTTLHVLPFLGEEGVVDGQPLGNEVRFAIPVLDRGAVAWFE
jgi:hypothetical protein